jgi:septal ring factor EnvC (AmiA/AmiB activator)
MARSLGHDLLLHLFCRQRTEDKPYEGRAVETSSVYGCSSIRAAVDTTDDDTLNDLQAMLRDLERQKHDIEAIKYDLEEEAAKLEKLNAKIEKFERWCETVRERFTDPESQTDITYEEKRLAIQILHIVAVIYPSTQKERVELTATPPNISKLLRDLLC